MRTLDEIRANWDTFMTGSQGAAELAEEQLFTDIPDMLAALAEKDAEIKRLTDVVEFRRVTSNVQNQDIIELRATVAHLREWC